MVLREEKPVGFVERLVILLMFADQNLQLWPRINYQENKKPPICQLQINGKTVEMMIDLGASVNLLEETTFQRINSSHNENLKPIHTKIYSYGCETPLPLLGTFTATVRLKNASTCTPLLVVKRRNDNLLRYHTAQKLGLITVSVNIATITDRDTNKSKSLKELGKLPNKQVKWHIDLGVTPRQQLHRRIPFHVEKEVKRLIRHHWNSRGTYNLD